MLTLNDGRTELWQWDTGRKLSVDADCSQVHFSNKVFGRSVDVDVVDGVAIVPDILLQTDKDLIAWAFVGTAENGYTKISKVFKVNKRNKPADYVFTPTDQTTLGEILDRIEDLESLQDPEAIKNAVDDYLANNPINVEETDPTVPAWAKAASKPSYSKSEVGLGNVENVKQYSASNPPPYPVKSVNGKTGAVTLDAAAVGARPSNWMPSASDVGALPAGTKIPTKTSDLANDSGFVKGSFMVSIIESDDGLSADKTPMEIALAFSDGRYVYANYGGIQLGLAAANEDVAIFFLNGGNSVGQFTVLPDKTVTMESFMVATEDMIPTKTSDLTNDSGFLTDYTETDPTVPTWAKAASKPSYSKSEVGLGNLDNVKQYSASNPPPYPVTSVNGKTGAVKLDVDVTADKVEAALGYVPADSETVLLSDDLLQETEYTIAPYTNMIDRYGSMARTQLNRNGGVSEATWNVWVTNYIPIRKGQKMHIKFNDGASFKDGLMFALYDENKTLHDDYHIAIYLSAIVANPTVYGTLTIDGNYAVWDTSTIGYGGWASFEYVRFMYESTACIITIDEEITDELETVYELKPTVKIPKGNLNFDVAEKPLVGKKVVCFGDSLFGQTRDETSALYHTAQITGADLCNVGFGGTSAAKVGSGAFAQFSLPALTDAIISGTWTLQDSNVSAATGWNEQLPKLKGINFSAVDIIVLHYGTNDFMSAYTLEGTAVSTVCGGLRYSIEKILAKYPQIKFFISVPCFRYWGSAGAYTYPDTYTNSNGAKLTDFVEGIRKVAAEYNFPVIDSFYGMGVNKFNAAHYLADQTHHSVAGRKLFGEFIAAQITSQQSVAKSGMDTEAVQSMIDAAIAAIPVYNGEVV